MNKTATLFALLILVSSIALAQGAKTDREDAGLVGPVKTVQSRSVDYSGDKIVGEGFMKREGDLVVYNPGGQEIDRKPVSDFGQAMGTMFRKFDSQGRLAESSSIDPKGTVLSKEIFIYLNGTLNEVQSYDGLGRLVETKVREYDTKGRLKAEVYIESGKPVARTIYSYAGTDVDLPSEIAFFMADGRKATAPVGPCLGAHRMKFDYNAKHQLAAKSVFEENGNQKQSFEWTYDGQGDVAEYFSETRGSTVKCRYKYKLDSPGNWIEQIANCTSLEKGLTVFGHKPIPYVRSTVTTREITYY